MTDIRHQKWRAVDKPEPGCFLVKRVRGGPRVPARICCDRGMWWAEINGVRVGEPNANPFASAGVDRIWHGGMAITQGEHDRLVAAIHADPSHPANRPNKPVNLQTLPPLF